MKKWLQMLILKYTRANNKFHLKVSNEHKIYVEDYGNKDGEVFIFLHGGPGGSVDYSNLRWFDLKRHRVILLEQRGCNRSIGNFYKDNDTFKMVEDIETLRNHLKLNKINIFGGSWGSCLALAYAIKYPDNIKRIFLWGLLLGNKKDTEFIPSEYLSPEEKYYCDNLFFFPEDNWIINHCSVLKDTTIYLAHGTDDIACNYKNSLLLKEKLPNINLFIEEGGIHSSSSPGIESFLLNNVKK